MPGTDDRSSCDTLSFDGSQAQRQSTENAINREQDLERKCHIFLDTFLRHSTIINNVELDHSNLMCFVQTIYQMDKELDGIIAELYKCKEFNTIDQDFLTECTDLFNHDLAVVDVKLKDFIRGRCINERFNKLVSAEYLRAPNEIATTQLVASCMMDELTAVELEDLTSLIEGFYDNHLTCHAVIIQLHTERLGIEQGLQNADTAARGTSAGGLFLKPHSASCRKKAAEQGLQATECIMQ